MRRRELTLFFTLAVDTLTTRSLQAQVEASNVDRENSNRVKVSSATSLDSLEDRDLTNPSFYRSKRVCSRSLESKLSSAR